MNLHQGVQTFSFFCLSYRRLNAADYKTLALSDEIEIATEMCSTNDDETVQCCEEFLDLAELIMEDEGLNHPSTADEALVLYRKLVIYFEKLL